MKANMKTKSRAIKSAPLQLFKGKTSGRQDTAFLILVLLISAFGSIMVFSAGGPYAQARYGDENYFIKKQLIWLLLGLAVMLIASKIPVSVYQRLTPALYALSVVLLLLVLIFGFVGNGAQRWISIGPLTIQPSEIAKLTLIMMLSNYFYKYEKLAMSKRSKKAAFLYGTLIPCLILILPTVLVMLQKHLSCIIILGVIGLLLIFSAGVDPKYIGVFCTMGVAAVSCIALFTDYTKERITVWRDPEAYKLTGGWQTLQGLMAIGSGGLFGVGLGKSVLKHCYVSEPANDMIFAILCEELGFVGAAAALLIFALLVLRGAKISSKCQNTFSRLLTLGISIKMATQVLLNVAVVTNSIPNTGISLPFFSYGGSSLIMLFFEMGIVLSVSRETAMSK